MDYTFVRNKRVGNGRDNIRMRRLQRVRYGKLVQGAQEVIRGPQQVGKPYG